MRNYEGVIHRVSQSTLSFTINPDIYTTEGIFRTAYIFLDRCYLFLYREPDHQITVLLKAKTQDTHVDALTGEFLNELINQRLRIDIGKETGKIRELIVAQAFAESGVLENERGVQSSKESDVHPQAKSPDTDKDDYHRDPYGVAR